MVDKGTRLGVAQVPIRATLDELDKDLSKAKGKIEGSLSNTWQKIGSSVAKVAKAAVIGGAGALAAAGAGVSVALGKMALDALPVQGVADAFAGITGNAEEALATLREGSLGMVRDAELMESYNSAAQLVGKTFADQLPGAMGYLSKVSAATGQDMGFMIDSLVKGVGRLSPMILDNLGIQVQLSDATARAAEMFGVEEDALTKTQVQAGMMDVVLQKLAENTADMPEVAGTAQQKWAAFGVTMQNFKDRIGLTLIPVLQKILTPLAALADKHGPRLVALFETRMLPVVERVASAFGRLIEGDTAGALDMLFGPEIAGQIMSTITTLQQVADFIGANLTPILAGLAAAIIASVVPAFVSWAAAAIPAAIATVAAFAPVIAIIVAIGLAVGLLVAAWQNDWGGIRTTLTEFWANTAQPILSAIWNWFTVTLPEALTTISEWFITTWTNIATFFVTLWETISVGVTTAWNTIVAFFVTLWETISTSITTAWTAIAEFFTGLWEGIRLGLETAWLVITSLLTFFWELITGLTEPLWRPVLDFLTWLWGAISEGITVAWTAISEFFTTIWNAISTTFSTVLAAVQEALSAAWDSISEAIQTTWTAISDWFTTWWATLTDAWNTTIATIQEVLSTAWDTIYATISTVWETISEFFTTWWNTQVESFETALGIVEDALSTAWDSISKTVETVWNTIKDTISGVVSTLWDKVFKGPFEDLERRWEGFWGGITTWLTDLMRRVHIPMPHITVHYREVPILGRIPSGASVAWYGMGGQFVANRPMLIGVGEMGPELVTVERQDGRGYQRGGDSGGLSIGEFHAHYVEREDEMSVRHTLRALQMAGG